jgi:hypothetical protein
VHLEARVATLEATMQDLLERLPQDSRTSSLPPSNDLSQSERQRCWRQPSGRRPGGQLGHRGQTQMLVLVAEIDKVIFLIMPPDPRIGAISGARVSAVGYRRGRRGLTGICDLPRW